MSQQLNAPPPLSLSLFLFFLFFCLLLLLLLVVVVLCPFTVHLHLLLYVKSTEALACVVHLPWLWGLKLSGWQYELFTQGT